MNGRDNGFFGCTCLLAPVLGRKIFAYHSWGSRDRCNQRAIRTSEKHAVNIRMRIEGGVKPLLAGGRRIRPAENFGDLGKCLIIINDGTTAAEIVADQMAHELDQSLSVAQDPRFQGVAQNRIRNNQGQDRRDPARQKNRENNRETIEMIAPSFRCWISPLHACLFAKKLAYHGHPAGRLRQGRMSY